jgi:molybdate/tungstate transport system substrate-binding protein
VKQRGLRPVSSLLLFALALCGCKSRATEIVVYHAASLTAVLGDAMASFQKQDPNVRIRLEPSGSQVAIRKITELGMRADVVAVADATLIEKMMLPSHATWNGIFATNEIVLAHKEHSKATDQITAKNWPEILTRQDVRLGRADPDTAPIGYLTLMVWQLAEKYPAYAPTAENLSSRLSARCSNDHVVHDETELLALLESRAIDYAFLFRSTAEDHHLKIVTLPDDINLSRQELTMHYGKVGVDVRMKRGGMAKIQGGVVTYGLTIPTNAPHPDPAVRFVKFLLGQDGRQLLVRRGFHATVPARCAPCTGLPAGLQPAFAEPSR